MMIIGDGQCVAARQRWDSPTTSPEMKFPWFFGPLLVFLQLDLTFLLGSFIGHRLLTQSIAQAGIGSLFADSVLFQICMYHRTLLLTGIADGWLLVPPTHSWVPLHPPLQTESNVSPGTTCRVVQCVWPALVCRVTGRNPMSSSSPFLWRD